MMLWSPNHSMEGKSEVFNGYKQTSKVSFVYLDVNCNRIGVVYAFAS